MDVIELWFKKLGLCGKGAINKKDQMYLKGKQITKKILSIQFYM